MASNMIRIDPMVFSDTPFFSRDQLSKTLVRESACSRLYQIIINIANAWSMYYGAQTDEEKGKAELTIKLLESERSRVLGLMVN